MLRKEFWYNYPFIYDNEKYDYEDNQDSSITFKDKKYKNKIFHVLSPILINQITDNEFIIVHAKSKNLDGKLIFVHLHYDGFSKKVKIIYKKEYKSKSTFGEIIHFDEIYLMESWLETTIYNSKTNQSVTLENSKVQRGIEELKDTHLIAKIEIEEQDNLMMYIDKNTLEFDGFYSQLQDRFISIQSSSDDFNKNFEQTLQNEILKYIELLNEREEYNQELKDKKTEKLLRKHLTKKK